MDTRERCVGETGCAGCLRERVDAGRKWRHSMRYGATQRDTAPLNEIRPEKRRKRGGMRGWRVMIFFEDVGFGELVLQVELRGGRL